MLALALPNNCPIAANVRGPIMDANLLLMAKKPKNSALFSFGTNEAKSDLLVA